MIRCLSCRKSSDNPNLYLVKLISNTPLNKMPTSGKDVIGLTNSARFAIGSELIISMPQGTKKYIYGEKGFESDDGILNSKNIKIETNGSMNLTINDDGIVYF